MNQKWPIYFMKVAEDTAELSKDPITKVGAVLVKHKKIKSAGYNGAPAPFPDDLVPKDSESDRLIEKKNTFMCHAELNAVLNYDGEIKSLKGADMFVTISPCHACACMLAQIGIKRIIYKEKYHRVNETEAAEYILDKCNVKYYDFETFLKEES